MQSCMCSSLIALTVMRNIVIPSAPTSSNPLSSTFSKLHHKKKKKSRQNYFYPALAMLGSLSCRRPTLYFFPFFGPKEPISSLLLNISLCYIIIIILLKWLLRCRGEKLSSVFETGTRLDAFHVEVQTALLV